MADTITAPAPAPAAPAPATPAPAAPSPSRPTNRGFPTADTSPNATKTSYDALDKLFGAGDETPPKPAPQQRQPEPQPDPEPEVEPKPEVEAKGKTEQAPPAESVKPADQIDVDKMSPRVLRDRAKSLAKMNADLQKQITELKEKPADTAAETKYQQELEARDKRIAALDEELRFTNYERSEEYKTKWEKPFVDAYGQGRSKVAQLKVTLPDGTERAGTPQDFDSIMRITNDSDAAEKAFEMFGNKASLVMYHRERVNEKNGERETALEDYKTNGADRLKERTAKQELTVKNIANEIKNLWKTHAETPRTKYPQYFQPVEGDTQGNELLEKGFQSANQAFQNLDPTNPNLSPAQREVIVRAHATVLNKAAAFDRLAYHLSKEKAAREAAEKKLKEFEASEPGAPQSPGRAKEATGKGSAMDTAFSGMEKYAR